MVAPNFIYDIKKVPSYLLGLAETRARADGQVLRIEQTMAELQTEQAKARETRASCDVLIERYHNILNAAAIASVKAWKGRYGDPKAYIGQTSDMPMRFPRHNAEKDFWERALVLISKTQSLTQTHALFLEWHCLQEAKKAGRYVTTNGNNASRPYTPAPLEADCYEVYDTARTLLATLGHPLFEPVVRVEQQQGDKPELLFCRGSSADGKGYYTEEGFVVLAGSTGRRGGAAKPNTSISGNSARTTRA